MKIFLMILVGIIALICVMPTIVDYVIDFSNKKKSK